MMTEKINPLGVEHIGRLLIRFAVPCILGMVISASYNLVDQIFIGRSIGIYGNAATNVAFPLAIICTALSLLFGIGGAANYNLNLGRKEYDKARFFAGNTVFLMLFGGIALSILVLLFLKPLLLLCGGTEQVMPYAESYVSVTALGIPFLILTIGGGHLIRGDGSPNYAMACSIVGAVINTILDPVFLFGFKTGIVGAAWASVIGQVVSGGMVLFYLTRFHHVTLGLKDLRPRVSCCLGVMALGLAPFFNQLAMMVVQIVLNNSLTFYGAASSFGSNIPLACAGIVSKVSMLFFSVIIGMAQGLQPIVGFNYGARQYDRVKEAYLKMLMAAVVVSVVSFLVFQLFPRPLASLFGDGGEEYFLFAEDFFRIFLFGVLINGIQPITANFFTAIGKPLKGVFMSLTRQILFLLPLLLILPLYFSLDGILYAAPIADFMAAITAVLMIIGEFKQMDRLKEDTVR